MLTEQQFDQEGFFDIAKRGREYVRERYPDWTNDNIADPGITLLDLFAYLKEIQNYHMDQTGPSFLKKYLKLLGIVPIGYQPGKAFLTLNVKKQAKLLKGTRMYAGHIPFETQREQMIAGNILYSFESVCSGQTSSLSGEWLREGKGLSLYPFGKTPRCEDIFLIRLFEVLIPHETYGLYLGLTKEQCCSQEHIGAFYDGYGYRPPAVLELYTEAISGWEKAIIEDETLGLSKSGILWFHFREKLRENPRLKLVLKECDYQIPPQLLRISLSITPVLQQETLETKPEYEAFGFPGYRIDLGGDGLCKEDFLIEIEDPLKPGFFCEWELKADLDSSHPEDRHYMFDGSQLVFGNGFHGMIPEGQVRIKRWIKTLGRLGNIKSGTITMLEKPNDSIISVTNEMDVKGGTDEESLEEAFLRYKNTNFNSLRAVTLKDYETLVLNAPGMLIEDCRAFWLKNTQNHITIAVKPKTLDGHGVLTETIKRNLFCILEEKRLIGTVISLISPDYVFLTVTCEAVGNVKYRNTESLIRDAVERFMGELKFGQSISYGRLFSYLDMLACVEEVKSLWLETEGKASRNGAGDVLIPFNGLYILKQVNCVLYSNL